MVTDVNNNSYTVLIDDKTTTVKTAVSLQRGSAVEIQKTTDGQLAKSLLKLGSGAKVEGYSQGRIRVNGKNYLVSDYVKVYGGTYANQYVSMSMSQIMDSDNVRQVTLYSDRALSSGGIVRVIIVQTK